MRARSLTRNRRLMLTVIAAMLAAPAAAQPTLEVMSPRELLAVLSANAGLTGNVVLGIAARERLAARGRADSAAVVPLIIEALRAPRAPTQDARQRNVALLGVLADIGPAAADAVPILSEFAADTDPRAEWLRFQAGLALTDIGTRQADAARAEAERRNLADWAQRTDADALARSVEEQAYLVRRELRSVSPDGAIIDAALAALTALGDRASAATPSLLRAFSDPRLGSGVRQRVGTLLATLGVPDAAAASHVGVLDLVADVIEDTRNPVALVHSLAMLELGHLGPSEPAIDALLDALRAGRSPGDAARELGNYGAAASRAVPALLAIIDDEVAGTNAIQAIGRIGVADDAVVTALRRLVVVPEGRHRTQAAAALGELHADAAVPELVTALTDSRGFARSAAARALGALGPAAVGAVTPLAALLRDGDTEVRLAALGALGRIGTAAAPAVPEIARQLDADERRIAAAATQALEQIGGDAAWAALAADAQRYAAADRADYLQRRGGGPEPLRDLLRSLPEERRVALAQAVANDADLHIAETGAEALLDAGRGDRAVPALARLVAGGEQGDRLFLLLQQGALGGGTQLFGAVVAHLRANYSGLPPAQQQRVYRAFAAAGLAPLP